MIKNIIREMKRLHQDESGAAALEYGLIVGGIALAIVTAVNLVGTNLGTMFGRISTAIGLIGV